MAEDIQPPYPKGSQVSWARDTWGDGALGLLVLTEGREEGWCGEDTQQQEQAGPHPDGGPCFPPPPLGPPQASPTCLAAGSCSPGACHPPRLQAHLFHVLLQHHGALPLLLQLPL